MADEPPPMDFEETPPPEDDIEQEKNENPFGDPSEVEEKETANEPPSKQEGIDSLIVQKWAWPVLIVVPFFYFILFKYLINTYTII